MKNKLIIFTGSYPYGLTETFLHNEVKFLSKEFDVEIHPLIKKTNVNYIQHLPSSVKFFEPFLPRSYYKRIILGIFNFSPIFFYLKDLYTLFKSSSNIKSSLKEWFLYLITYRAVLANHRFKKTIKSSDAIYFYWGNYPIKQINAKKLFVRVHGGEVNFKRHFGYIPCIDQKVIMGNVVYLPISEDAKRMIVETNPGVNCNVSRLGVSFNGKNPAPKSNDIIRIVSCSNVISLKRVELIANALLKINDLEIEWIHFGDGPLLTNIKIIAQKFSRNIKTKFNGRVKNTDVLDFYKESYVDVFINVSETEGVPVSIMEALSFGIPCFATNVGGTSEILNNTGGKIVDKDFNIDILVDFIREIRLNNEKFNLRLGAFELWELRCIAEDNYNKFINVLKN